MSKATVTTTLKLYQAKHKLFPWGVSERTHSISDGASCTTVGVSPYIARQYWVCHRNLCRIIQQLWIAFGRRSSPEASCQPRFRCISMSSGDGTGRSELQAAWTLCPYYLGSHSSLTMWISHIYFSFILEVVRRVLGSMLCHPMLVAEFQVSECSTQGVWHFFLLLPHQRLVVKLIACPRLFQAVFQDGDEQI